MLLQSALYDSHDPFDMFHDVETIKTSRDIKPGTCLLLHGGEDISPSLYNHKVSKHCHASEKPSYRDIIEKEMIEQAIAYNNPIIGICRGAQLLCAMDGGYLVQHIEGHGYDKHTISSNEYGNMGESNSAHHQMMQPRKSRETKIIGFVDEKVYGYEQEDKLREYPLVPEVVNFRALNALGIQGHPEWMKPSDKYIQYLQEVIRSYLGVI